MSARVYLGGLPDSINLDDIHKSLSIYGRITEVKLRHGYGFVQFASEKDVVHTFANRPFLGVDISVELARPDRHTRARATSDSTDAQPLPKLRITSSRQSQNKAKYAVIVKNLNKRTCWQELKDFGRLLGGEVAYCDIDRSDRTQGFINYTNDEDAERAVQELDGKELQGNILQLSRHSLRHGPPDRKSKRNGRSRSPVPAARYEPDHASHRDYDYTRQRQNKTSSRSDGDWRDRSFYESFGSHQKLNPRGDPGHGGVPAPPQLWGGYGAPSMSRRPIQNPEWSIDHGLGMLPGSIPLRGFTEHAVHFGRDT